MFWKKKKQEKEASQQYEAKTTNTTQESMKMEESTERTQQQQVDNADPSNFVEVDTLNGQLLKAKKNLENFMVLRTQNFFDIDQGDAMMVLNTWYNDKTDGYALVLLNEQEKVFYECVNLEEEFEVVEHEPK